MIRMILRPLVCGLIALGISGSTFSNGPPTVDVTGVWDWSAEGSILGKDGKGNFFLGCNYEGTLVLSQQPPSNNLTGNGNLVLDSGNSEICPPVFEGTVNGEVIGNGIDFLLVGALPPKEISGTQVEGPIRFCGDVASDSQTMDGAWISEGILCSEIRSVQSKHEPAGTEKGTELIGPWNASRRETIVPALTPIGLLLAGLALGLIGLIAVRRRRMGS